MAACSYFQISNLVNELVVGIWDLEDRISKGRTNDKYVVLKLRFGHHMSSAENAELGVDAHPLDLKTSLCVETIRKCNAVGENWR